MKNLKLILAALCCMVCHSVMAQEPDASETRTPDRTPVAEEELDDLPPDFTFNDARSVLEIIRDNVDFDTFHKSLRSTEMIKQLDSTETITVFAPQNGAFDRLTEDEFNSLRTPAGAEKMQKILSYHIVPEEYDRETLVSTVRLNEGILRLKTLQGGYIALTLAGDRIYITDELGKQSKVNMPDMEAENGVVHGISKLLLPQ